jgi:hypothetical protein
MALGSGAKGCRLPGMRGPRLSTGRWQRRLGDLYFAIVRDATRAAGTKQYKERTPMKIIVTHLPSEVTAGQLQRFLTAPFYLFGSLQMRRVDLISCEIVEIRDNRTGITELVGLAKVTPEKAGLRIIKRCHGGVLGGKRVRVRKFFDRVGTDRRLAEAGAMGQADRPEERRRPELSFRKPLKVTSRGYKEYARQYD